MADRVLMICWGGVAKGREERAVEVFNDTVGMCGRMQQDGRIEKFDIALCEPNGSMDGYVALHGTAAQLAALREDEEFQANTADAQMVCDDLRHVSGYTGEAVARLMGIYQESLARVPQMT